MGFLQAWLIVTVIFLASCTEQPAEEALRHKLSLMEMGLEERKPSLVLDQLHPDFQSENGKDTVWLQRLLAYYNFKKIKITVVITNLEITLVDDQVARMEFNSLVTAGRGLLPDQGRVYKVQTNWHNVDGDWLLIYASWQLPGT